MEDAGFCGSYPSCNCRSCIGQSHPTSTWVTGKTTWAEVGRDTLLIKRSYNFNDWKVLGFLEAEPGLTLHLIGWK